MIKLKGRPLGSEIRQAIVEILNVIGKGTGYDVYKIYREIYPAATMRSIYYHLKKGIETEEFIISEIKDVSGNYSWGPSAKKTYYGLGPKAHPKGDKRVKVHLEKIKEKLNK